MSNNLFDLITSQLKPEMIERLGAQIGASSDQASKGIEAGLPAILGQLARNARSSDGAAALQRALQKDHQGGLLDNLSGFFENKPDSRDSRMLDHIFGGRREQVQNGLGQASGLSSGQMGDLLAKLGPLVMGGLGKATQGGQSGLDQLGSLLGKENDNLRQRGGGAFSLVEKMLDVDGDGDVDAADLLKGATKKGLGGLLGGLFGRRR